MKLQNITEARTVSSKVLGNPLTQAAADYIAGMMVAQLDRPFQDLDEDDADDLSNVVKFWYDNAQFLQDSIEFKKMILRAVEDELKHDHI